MCVCVCCRANAFHQMCVRALLEYYVLGWLRCTRLARRDGLEGADDHGCEGCVGFG